VIGRPLSDAERTRAADLDPVPNEEPLEGGRGLPIESNAWAIAPARTRDGHALLFQNPHVGFFGSGQRWEVHLRSASGWHVAGFAILGTPIIRSGHNEQLGWTHTNTAADPQDAFRVQFDHPADSLAYRRAGGWEQATTHEADVFVRTEAGLERQRYRFLRTAHGPVVGLPGGGRAAVRIARFEEGGSIQQWLAMGHATSLDSFRAALAQTAFPISNTMYADRAGNIMYIHGNAVPRRDPRFDWTRPVDGGDPNTDWQGYHALDELPQLLNPASGWIQNTNATPFLATADGSNLRHEDYPSYMAREVDNARAKVSRRILGERDDWTLDQLARAAFDTRVLNAETDIPRIIDEWERLGADEPERALAIETAIDALREWDRRSTVDSPAMTIYILWAEALLAAIDDDAADGRDEATEPAPEWPLSHALETALQRLRAGWDTALVPWGEVNRLQRVHTSGAEPFDDDRPSLPVAGAPGGVGIVFAFGTRPGPSGRRRYGVRGHTWVGLVEFADLVAARSIVTFGQSADPASPHWFDQAPLYVRGEFKPAWFVAGEVLPNARRSYNPGREAEAGSGSH
jgi:acyl-homoserine lactone acylase PvdQ